MNTMQLSQFGSRRLAALLLALALALVAQPCAAAPAAQDDGLLAQLDRTFSFPSELLDLLYSLFEPSDDVRSTYEKSGHYIDPDGQSLAAPDSMLSMPAPTPKGFLER